MDLKAYEENGIKYLRGQIPILDKRLEIKIFDRRGTSIQINDKKYTISEGTDLNKIRCGGSGIIWPATSQDRKEYVIKFLPRSNEQYIHDDFNRFERFKREQELFQMIGDVKQNLNPKNILHECAQYVIDMDASEVVEEENSNFDSFLIFPFIDNTLRNKVDEYQKHQTVAQKNNSQELYIKQIFPKICKGVFFLHMIGVIHRDLSPSNILISSNNNPIIIDLGISKCKDGDIKKVAMNRFANLNTDITLSHKSCSQQLWSILLNTETFKDVGMQYDIRSLGLLLYFIIKGSSPFEVVFDTIDNAKRNMNQFLKKREYIKFSDKYSEYWQLFEKCVIPKKYFFIKSFDTVWELLRALEKVKRP